MGKPEDPLERMAAMMSAVHAFRRTMAEFGRRVALPGEGDLALSDLFALQHVLHAGSVTAGELGRSTGLTSGAVTSMVDRLEQAGYLQRRRSVADRRVVELALKPQGRVKLTRAMHQAHREIAAMFAGWSVADIERLTALLERLELRRGSQP